MDRKEKIAEMLAARSICREGSLSFSCPKLEFSVKAGKTVEGSFTVTGREDAALSGIIITGDIRMRCLTPEFRDNPSEIFYRFDSTGLDEGETCRGEFKAITNQGEYTLSYVAVVLPELFETSLGPMKNLFHFANLAKTSWQEAVKAFYSPDFEKILSGNDRQYLSGYRALAAAPWQEQKVEEFLMWVRKKQPITYVPDRESMTVSLSEDMLREVVTLTRDGWGYTRLSVETDGAFLEAEKDVLTDDDFLGNQCPCGLLIFRDALHGGRNYGKVRFFNEYVSMEIPVCAEYKKKTVIRQKKNRRQKMLEFYQQYLYYSIGRLSKREWLTATESIVLGMDFYGKENPVKELFQAHIQLTRERYKEAKWLLEYVEGVITPEGTRPEVSCYYLYLTTLAGRDERYVRAVTEEIRRVYQTDPSNWKVAWLLLYLDEECGRSISRKWIFLEQQFEKGCRSPVWYMEAAMLVRKNPAFLMKLTPFVMQTLNFMAKYDFLSDACIGQVHYLADRLKQYSHRMYVILQACYEKKRDNESLRTICTLLIKGNKTGPEYARWYRKGIEKELWVTRLYEYYILSIDLQKKETIPSAALRYFSYRSELPYERMAYLYAYVMRKRDKYPDLYRIYFPDMEKFLIQQLEKRRMNRDIAFMFREMIQEEMASGELLGNYVDRLFFHEIRVGEPGIRRVIAVHGKLRDETVWPVNGDTAYVPLYDRDFSLIFEKDSGGRFVYNIPYEDKTLFYPEEMLFDIIPDNAGLFTEETGVTLYQCEHGRSYTVVDKANAQYAQRLWDCGRIREAYRDELGMKLLQYYFAEDMSEEMDQYLSELRPDRMSGRERAEAVQFLVFRGMYDTAYEWLGKYGPEKVRSKAVARMCSRLIPCYDFIESENMTVLAHMAFRKGKYDEDILRYLSRYFKGTVREMLEIWQACDRFEAGSYELCERLLLQMLFTGQHIPEETEVYRKYLEGSADEMLADAYLTHLAYQYFMDGQALDPFIWKEMQRKSRNGERQGEICELALLRYFAGKESLDEEEWQMVREFIDDLMLKRGIVFAFFTRFKDIIPVMDCYMNKTFLEYRSESENPLILHYMRKSGEKSGDYRMEELKNCYAGIYVRSFQLFAGETIQYYITEKIGEKEKLTESGTLGGGEETEPSDGRFAMINGFLRRVLHKKEERAKRALAQYCQTEFFAEKLFTLL